MLAFALLFMTGTCSDASLASIATCSVEQLKPPGEYIGHCMELKRIFKAGWVDL